MTKTEALRLKISKAFATSVDPTVADDIAFHMTDWNHDVEDLFRLYERPDSFNDEEVVSIVLQFLAHVPNHVAAAKKLAGIGPIEDIFGVGVLREEDDE